MKNLSVSVNKVAVGTDTLLPDRFEPARDMQTGVDLHQSYRYVEDDEISFTIEIDYEITDADLVQEHVEEDTGLI